MLVAQPYNLGVGAVGSGKLRAGPSTTQRSERYCREPELLTELRVYACSNGLWSASL